jgi:hypothetical protein
MQLRDAMRFEIMICNSVNVIGPLQRTRSSTHAARVFRGGFRPSIARADLEELESVTRYPA